MCQAETQIFPFSSEIWPLISQADRKNRLHLTMPICVNIAIYWYNLSSFKIISTKELDIQCIKSLVHCSLSYFKKIKLNAHFYMSEFFSPWVKHFWVTWEVLWKFCWHNKHCIDFSVVPKMIITTKTCYFPFK